MLPAAWPHNTDTAKSGCRDPESRPWPAAASYPEHNFTGIFTFRTAAARSLPVSLNAETSVRDRIGGSGA